MSILTGKAIERAVLGSKKIEILPFNPKQINPNSYDLRLGEYLLVYKPPTFWDEVKNFLGLWSMDSKKMQACERIRIPKEGYVLKPGELYLGHTEERVHTDSYVSVVDGKSSIGRLGIFVHVTAGYVDNGFDGQVTLELAAVKRVRVYPGMRIAQIRYHEVNGGILLYKGNYQGQTATGPVPSHAWKQFLDDNNKEEEPREWPEELGFGVDRGMEKDDQDDDFWEGLDLETPHKPDPRIKELQSQGWKITRIVLSDLLSTPIVTMKKQGEKCTIQVPLNRLLGPRGDGTLLPSEMVPPENTPPPPHETLSLHASYLQEPPEAI